MTADALQLPAERREGDVGHAMKMREITRAQ